MCYFLTIQVPKSIPEESGKIIAKQNGFNYLNIENKSVSSFIKKPCEIYLTTNGMCDCGTSIGSLHEKAADYPLKKVKRMITKKRNQGWSESRIDRWVSQISGNYDKEQEKEEKLRKQCVHNPPDEVKRWANFIKTFLNETKAAYIGICKHLYNGGLDEHIEIKETITFSINGDVENKLLNLNNDIIYMFVK